MKKISIEKLSQLVQRKRTDLKLTQDQLGNLTGINRLLIGRIESQKFIPSLPQLECLLKTLEISFDDIIEEESEEDVFVALRGKANTPEERNCIDKMISMMLCLRKQEVLRRKLYE